MINLTNVKVRNILVFIILMLMPGLHGTVSGQATIKLNRLSAPIEFDGVPDESAWASASSFSLTMQRPVFGIQPTEKSDIRIGYDDKFLWVGASLFMTDPSKILEVSKKRDEELRGNDAFSILLDTYNDNENGLVFMTAPTGLRTDYTISNDASGTMGMGGFSSMNYSWNTFWDVKTTRDGKGWYVEMRIPFSSLKFKPEDDVTTMGLIIIRTTGSKNETSTYPAIDPKYGFGATNKPSLAGTIVIEGARPANPVYVSPYMIGGLSYDWIMNDPESEYMKDDPYPHRKLNAGLDVKYNINSNLTLDLTANTDFAQVEADDQQVNLTRYSLFFPEKRQFFQERSSLFDFSLGGFFDNLFYSRNIGISNGTPVGIIGGARLTGRVGNWDLGFLDMQTVRHGESPGENFGVLRMKRQVINANSFVGGMVTTRMGMDGKQNIAYGLDGIFRLFGDDYLTVKWAQTYDSEIGNRMLSLNPSFILADWTRRSEEGFAYSLNYIYSGQEFTPGIGFVMRSAIQGLNGSLLYGWIAEEKSLLHDYSIKVEAERYTRIDDGHLESLKVAPGFEINTKRNFHGEISLAYQEEGVAFAFPLSPDIWVEAGNYRFTALEGRIFTSESRKVSGGGEIFAGQFYDGHRVGYESRTNLNLSSSFRITAGYGFNAIRFPDREEGNHLNIHSVNVKALYMLSTKLSASLFVQYVNTDDELVTNFRLRYNPREGNDLYLVFNDFRAIQANASGPEDPAFFNRTVMVKYTHTFIW